MMVDAMLMVVVSERRPAPRLVLRVRLPRLVMCIRGPRT
jgi:hypothetical protein